MSCRTVRIRQHWYERAVSQAASISVQVCLWVSDRSPCTTRCPSTPRAVATDLSLHLAEVLKASCGERQERLPFTVTAPEASPTPAPKVDALFDARLAHFLTQQAAAPTSTEQHEILQGVAPTGTYAAPCSNLPEHATCPNGWGGILPARIHHPPGFMGFALQPHWQHGFTCVWQRVAETGQRRFSADILSTLLAHAIFRGTENGRMIRTIRHTLPCPAIAGAAGGAA